MEKKTTHKLVREPYVVTWWEGETRRMHVMVDEISAGREKAALKEQSQNLPDDVSLEPIRMMPQRIFQVMEQMKAHNDNFTCRHAPRLLRLCVPCLEASIVHVA